MWKLQTVNNRGPVKYIKTKNYYNIYYTDLKWYSATCLLW